MVSSPCGPGPKTPTRPARVERPRPHRAKRTCGATCRLSAGTGHCPRTTSPPCTARTDAPRSSSRRGARAIVASDLIVPDRQLPEHCAAPMREDDCFPVPRRSSEVLLRDRHLRRSPTPLRHSDGRTPTKCRIRAHPYPLPSSRARRPRRGASVNRRSSESTLPELPPSSVPMAVGSSRSGYASPSRSATRAPRVSTSATAPRQSS